MNVLTTWRLDPLPLAFCLAAAVLYVGGMRRLTRRQRHWSRARATAFLSGLLLILVATHSAIGVDDTTSFSAHVAQHVLLGIAAPFLCALGAPITLALQASHRTTQVNLLRVIRSRVAQVATHPVVALALFTATLFVLYFSPLYELSLRNAVVHDWVHVHFVVVGSLFFWVTIGLDPVAHRVPYGARLLLVVLTVPFHAFLGLALLSMTQPLAAAHYLRVEPSAVSLLHDQQTGAALMWAIGDVIGLAAGFVVAQQWWRHEERRATRFDRRDDRARQEAVDAASA